jgi:ACT domain-containing protein
LQLQSTRAGSVEDCQVRAGAAIRTRPETALPHAAEGSPVPEASNRIIVTVIGQDRTGIIAGTSRVLADVSANIIDISQTVMGEFFVMIMMVDLAQSTVTLDELKARLTAKGSELGVRIDAQHQDVFRYMHRV